MNHLSKQDFEKQSLVELVILPRMDYLPYISEIINSFNHLIVLDTQGVLNKSFGSYSWIDKEQMDIDLSTNNNRPQARINYSFIYSTNDLFNKLELLNNYKNFCLLIDSVTFISDKAPNSIKSLSKAIWKIIYESNSMVIVINHYRIGKEKRTYKLIPRMGTFWEESISYRVKFCYKSGNIDYKIIKNELIDSDECYF